MNKLIILFFSCSFFHFLEANIYRVNGEVINDKRASELVTIITTTNPTPLLPSIEHLYKVQSSLMKIPGFRNCKKIIVFDGICPDYEGLTDDYNTYQNRIKDLIDKDPAFVNTEVIICKKWVHLCGTIKKALKRVNTPFIFIHQHDDVIVKQFDLNGCIASMLLNPNIKYIHFARDPNTCEKFLNWFGKIDSVIPGGSLVPLSRVFGWSDYGHLTTTDYYYNFILPQCDFGAMEWWIHPNLKNAVVGKSDKERTAIHNEFGAYLYGSLDDGDYLHHLDSRRIPGQEKERLRPYTERHLNSKLRQ